MVVERLDKRFGIVAIENGFIDTDQLLEAIKTQIVEDLEGAKRRLVGEILQEKGYISIEQIDEILKLMGIP